MVAALSERSSPFSLVVTGEAELYSAALAKIVGPEWIRTYDVNSDRELLAVVESGRADAAVLDDSADWAVDVLGLLRMIRRLDSVLPVVVVTAHRDRLYLENALRLAAFSVVVRPLQLEQLLRQIQRIMEHMDAALRKQRR